MWLKCLQIVAVESRGKMVQRYAGDWIKVGKQEAQILIAQGKAELPGQNALKAFVGGSDAGILVLGSRAAASVALTDLVSKIGVKFADTPSIPWAKTLIWNPMARLRIELIPTGLGLLDTWEVAMPLWHNYSLATHEGTTEDRAQTVAIIRDARVPMYDTRLIYVKRCENTQRLFVQWQTEREKGESDRLAFLRAFYLVKPFMLALPITWTGQHIEDDR